MSEVRSTMQPPNNSIQLYAWPVSCFEPCMYFVFKDLVSESLSFHKETLAFVDFISHIYYFRAQARGFHSAAQWNPTSTHFLLHFVFLILFLVTFNLTCTSNFIHFAL